MVQSTFIVDISSSLNYILLGALVWLTYFDSLHYGWVSDDHVEPASIANWDGKPQWTYKKTDKKYESFRFHTVWKWLRFLVGKVPHPKHGEPIDPKDPKKGKHPDWVCSPIKHHRLSLIFYTGCVLMLYTFLSLIFSPQVALLATALFVVHPFTCQTAVWVSGIGYLLGFLFMLMALCTALYTAHWTGWGMLLSVGLFSLFQFVAIQAMFSTIGAFAVLLGLGLYLHAVAVIPLAFFFCLPSIRGAVKLRTKVYKSQNMGKSTRFYPAKFIVAMKTLYYYTKLSFFPKRLGLYHTFGYHYELPQIELEDKYFWMGLGILILSMAGLVLGPLPLQLSILWYYGFIFIFLNWITIHQFVSERYLWMPVAGVTLLVSWLLVSYNLVWLWCILFGISIMRTWAHLPTYENELKFYHSNVWNFPQSEVAIGNLGVAFMRLGLTGAAMDHWNVGTRVNPNYDVNLYNIASTFRVNGQLDQARSYLVQALSSKTCHFKDVWERELDVVTADMAFQQEVMRHPEPMRLMVAKKLLTERRASRKYPKHVQELWKGRLKATNADVLKVQSAQAVEAEKAFDNQFNLIPEPQRYLWASQYLSNAMKVKTPPHIAKIWKRKMKGIQPVLDKLQPPAPKPMVIPVSPVSTPQ